MMGTYKIHQYRRRILIEFDKNMPAKLAFESVPAQQRNMKHH